MPSGDSIIGYLIPLSLLFLFILFPMMMLMEKKKKKTDKKD
jgi:hypothetical protein